MVAINIFVCYCDWSLGIHLSMPISYIPHVIMQS